MGVAFEGWATCWGFPHRPKLGSAFARKTKALARKALVLPFVGMAPFGRFFPACQRVRAGLFCSWHPCLPHRRMEPSGWISQCCGTKLSPDSRQVVVSFHCSHISFALPDPVQGQSATSLRTDDLLYTATACGGLVFTQPCLLQEPAVTADPLTLRRFVLRLGVM